MKLEPGQRYFSAACDTQVIVVRAPETACELKCGGLPMTLAVRSDDAPGEVASEAFGPTLIGKRYVNEAGSLELLCTKPGDGALFADHLPMQIKSSKPLPSSD